MHQIYWLKNSCNSTAVFFISLRFRSFPYTFCCLISLFFPIDFIAHLLLFLTWSSTSVSFKLLCFSFSSLKINNCFRKLIWNVFFTAYIALSLQTYTLSSFFSKYLMVYFYIVLTFCPPTLSLISSNLLSDVWVHWTAVRSQVACSWLNLRHNSYFIRLNLSVTFGTRHCPFCFLDVCGVFIDIFPVIWWCFSLDSIIPTLFCSWI